MLAILTIVAGLAVAAAMYVSLYRPRRPDGFFYFMSTIYLFLGVMGAWTLILTSAKGAADLAYVTSEETLDIARVDGALLTVTGAKGTITVFTRDGSELVPHEMDRARVSFKVAEDAQVTIQKRTFDNAWFTPFPVDGVDTYVLHLPADEAR